MRQVSLLARLLEHRTRCARSESVLRSYRGRAWAHPTPLIRQFDMETFPVDLRRSLSHWLPSNLTSTSVVVIAAEDSPDSDAMRCDGRFLSALTVAAQCGSSGATSRLEPFSSLRAHAQTAFCGASPIWPGSNRA